MNGHANNGKLAGKTAIVTGAARGLGRAYALRLAALGADVAIVDICLDAAREFSEALTAESVPEEIERLGRRSLGIQADLAQHTEAAGAIRRAHETFGRVDILVNNVIVNISSQSGISTYQHGLLAAYSAAKAALTHYTRYLAAELGPYGIRANCLAPGIMMTSRVAAQAALRRIGTNEEADRIPLRRLGEVEDCAGVLEFLTTDLSQYVTGQVISVCGGAVLTPN